MIEENQIFALYGNTVKHCVELARLYVKDDNAVGRMANSIFIEYNKKHDSVESYIACVKKGVQTHQKDRVVAFNIYKEIYKELTEKYPQTLSVLQEWIIRRGIVDFKTIDEKMMDYLYRNDYDYVMTINHDVRPLNWQEKSVVENKLGWVLPCVLEVAGGVISLNPDNNDTVKIKYEGFIGDIGVAITFIPTDAEGIVRDGRIEIGGRGIPNMVAEFDLLPIASCEMKATEMYQEFEKNHKG